MYECDNYFGTEEIFIIIVLRSSDVFCIFDAGKVGKLEKRE